MLRGAPLETSVLPLCPTIRRPQLRYCLQFTFRFCERQGDAVNTILIVPLIQREISTNSVLNVT